MLCLLTAVIGAVQVYASDAYTLPGNAAVLPCLVLPSDQAWAVEVTHWTVGPNNHLVDSHLVPQRIYQLTTLFDFASSGVPLSLSHNSARTQSCAPHYIGLIPQSDGSSLSNLGDQKPFGITL